MKLNLKEIREESGLSIAELAQISGVTRQTIWMIENGKTHTTKLSTLESLAHALSRNVSDLFLG